MNSNKLEICGFEHLHQHTSHGSLLDGYSTCAELAEYSKTVNQQYMCVTDHGMMSAIPYQIRECEKHNLTPIFGIEFYVNPLQPAIENAEEYAYFVKQLNEEETKKLRKSYHLLAIAYTQEGYKNLVTLSSWSHIYGLGGVPRRPRVNYEQLMKHKEGIMFSSCCYISEIGQAFDQYGEDAAMEKIMEYWKMFGDNFRLELMMLDFKKQKPYDAFIIKAHDKTGISLILTQDCHYTRKEDAKYQRYMLMTRTKNTIRDIEEAMKNNEEDKFFELQDTNLWKKSEEELNEKWLSDYQDIIPYELYCQSKANTVKICEMAKGVQLDRSPKLPEIPNANEKLFEEIAKGLKWRGLKDQPKYINQVKKEYELVERKGFATYFLIQKQFIDEAKEEFRRRNGWGSGSEAIGLGRGSGPSFLINYLLGITQIDPLKHNLVSERFLSDARGGKQAKLRFKSPPIEGELNS